MDMYRANDGCTYLRCGIIATIFVPTSNLRDLTVEDYINNTFFVKICLSHGYMSHGLYKGMAKFLLIKIISGNYCVYKKQFRMCGTAFCILCVDISGVDFCVCGVFLYEFATRTNVVAHEHGEYVIGFLGIANGHLFQRACLGVHGCLP